MRTILILLLFGLAILPMVCGGKPAPMPEDFSLSFYWNTGALPPQYRYEYVITIGPGQQGELDFIPGYDGAQGSERWVAPFNLSNEEIEGLYSVLSENDLLRTRWKTGRGLIGGSTTSLLITAFGNEYQIPSISVLEEDEKELVETAMDAVREVVPESIWEEMYARQTQYENEYAN